MRRKRLSRAPRREPPGDARDAADCRIKAAFHGSHRARNLVGKSVEKHVSEYPSTPSETDYPETTRKPDLSGVSGVYSAQYTHEFMSA